MGAEIQTDDATITRRKSWRDTLAADYEIAQAQLRYRLDEAGDHEEFI